MFDTVIPPLNVGTKVTKGTEASANNTATITMLYVAHCSSPAASKINQIAIVTNDMCTSTSCAVSQLEPPINTTKTNNITAAAASITIATANTQSISNYVSPTTINHTAIATTH